MRLNPGAVKSEYSGVYVLTPTEARDVKVGDVVALSTKNNQFMQVSGEKILYVVKKNVEEEAGSEPVVNLDVVPYTSYSAHNVPEPPPYSEPSPGSALVGVVFTVNREEVVEAREQRFVRVDSFNVEGRSDVSIQYTDKDLVSVDPDDLDTFLYLPIDLVTEEVISENEIRYALRLESLTTFYLQELINNNRLYIKE